MVLGFRIWIQFKNLKNNWRFSHTWFNTFYYNFIFNKRNFNFMISATRKWIFLKISSLLMVPLMVWFIVNFANLYDKNYQDIVVFFTNQLNSIIFSVFIIVTFFYSALSISEIFEDYITSEKTRKFANLMVFLSSLIIPTITIFTLYKL